MNNQTYTYRHKNMRKRTTIGLDAIYDSIQSLRLYSVEAWAQKIIDRLWKPTF